MRIQLSLLALALLLSSCTAPFRKAKPSPTSAVLLDRMGVERVLIVTADDFGRNRATNLGIIEGIEKGIVSCVAVMPVGNQIPAAYEYLLAHPELDVGVHLTLARDNIEPPWKPILPQEEVPSLVDGDGFLLTTIWEVFLKGDRGEIEKELEAQIEDVLKNGIEPTFLSFHKGFFQMHDPKTFGIVLRLAERYGLPVRRQSVFHDRAIAGSGILTTDKLVYDFGSYPDHEKMKKFKSIIDWLPRGLTEVVLHLAVKGEDEERVRGRRVELKVITAPETREYLTKRGVRLGGYRELRDLQRAMSKGRQQTTE